MTTQNEIQELAERHDLKYKQDEYGDPLIRRVPLDEIHVNSFKVRPKINCRNLDIRRLKTIGKTLESKGQGFGVIWGVEDSNKMIGIFDGNHLQNRARKFNQTHMRVMMWDVDISMPKGAWNLYAFSYELNKGGMYIVEKIASAYYGYQYHKRRGERWQDFLPTEFGEREQTLKRYIGIHKKCMKIKNLNAEAYKKLIKSSKINDWSETEFRNQVAKCLEYLEEKKEEEKKQYDDGEPINNTDGLVFKIINYTKDTERKVKMLTEEGRTVISDINKNSEKSLAEIDSLTGLQRENDLPLKSTKHKLNTSIGTLRKTLDDYKAEKDHITSSVESYDETLNKLEKFNHFMRNR